jgi:NAD(P)-dependent dehydrogenase (short-subunit alcohol dehydrogenase family)
MRFAQEGACVVVAEIAPAEGQSTVDSIRRTGGEALFVKTDASSEFQVKAMVESTLKQFGRIDILVNNAAVLHRECRAHEISNDEWDRTINVNLRGYWLCSRYVIPTMLSQKAGNILFVASRTGVRGFAGLAAYSASKGGVFALMRSMAADYAPDGIRRQRYRPGHNGHPHERRRVFCPRSSRQCT